MADCNAITNYLATESSRLGPWFWQKAVVPTTPLASIVPREAYPRGIGYDFRSITYERNLPTSILAWTSANAFSNGEDCGACATSPSQIDSGYTTRTTTLYKLEFKSREFCVEDLMRTWETQQQVRAIRDQLGQYVSQVWAQRYREDTFLACQYKVVSDGTIDGNYSTTIASTYPAACATDILQNALLDYWRVRLLRNGAYGGSIKIGQEPMLPLVIGPEASQWLLTQNDAIRNDLRYASPELLMNQFGAKVFRGYMHIIEPFPRRFGCTGGTYTEVPPFTSEAKTVLTGGEINAAYLSAPYEEAIICNRDLWTQLVPEPMASGGADSAFGVANYAGDFQWVNYQHENNIWRTMGRWYARLRAARFLKRPELGVAIVFKRCNEDMEAVPSTCVYS